MSNGDRDRLKQFVYQAILYGLAFYLLLELIT